MKKCSGIKQKILIYFGLLCLISAVHAQNSNESTPLAVDIEKDRVAIESRDSLYSKYLLEGDSVGIAAMYTKDGMMGCATGAKILASAGRWIRNGIKNDSRHVTFKAVTLNADDDLRIETGKAEVRNDKGELKYTFRYIVVWKKEDGIWKLYRDTPL